MPVHACKTAPRVESHMKFSSMLLAGQPAALPNARRVTYKHHPTKVTISP